MLSVHPLYERTDLTCEFEVGKYENPADSGTTRGHNERGHVGRVSFVPNHWGRRLTCQYETGAVFSVNCYFNSRNPISIQEKPVPARLFPR